MPQTDHVLVTTPKLSASPRQQLRSDRPTKSARSSPATSLKSCHGQQSRADRVSRSARSSPAVSHKSYHSARNSTVSTSAATESKRNGSQTEIKIVVENAENKEEKNNSFSIRWELQLSALVLVCFVVGLVIPVSMIIVGGVYLFSCPLNVMIPIFLIVCGSTFLISVFGLRKLNARRETEFDHFCYRVTFRSSVLFQLVWFAAGCFWVYGAYEPNYESHSEVYCNKSLYLYTFWLLNSIFIALGTSAAAFVTFLVCGRHSAATPTHV